MAPTRGAAIAPSDPSYLSQAVLLLGVQTGVLSVIIARPHDDTRLALIRTLAVSVLSAGTFVLLQQRYVTLQRACALRISRTHDAYTAATSRAVVLTASGMTTISTLLLVTSLLSHLPLVHVRLAPHSSLVQVTAPIGWWAAAMNVTICIACVVMATTQDPITFTFEQDTSKDEIPLASFSASGEWIKIASTSRRHDVYVRQPNARKTLEVTTRLASNHPLYNPERDTSSSGPTLHITL